MDGRMKKYREVSPERAKVWTEKSPKYHYNHQYNQNKEQQLKGKVPVVYYLCRNRQLEHPHFMEVPLSSPDGLYLRDVIERLNGLRGRGMASIYSWSCKRSYKNGFVWHDLSDDDLILPAHGNEYVLKGSELFEESNLGRFSPAIPIISQNQKALPEPPSSRSQEESSSSSSLNERTTKSSQDELSPESSMGKNSPFHGALSLTEYKADASTQTEESVTKTQTTCTKGVSTDDGPDIKGSSEICQNYISTPPSTSSATSSSDRNNTLESLIRADARKLNSFRILEEEEFRMPKFKATSMIMQLISCGSISVKDHSFGFIPTYKPRFSHSKFPSPFYSTNSMVGELDCLAENPRFTGSKLEDKEYFSGSFLETSMIKEGMGPTLKRSSSYHAERSTQSSESCTKDREESNSPRSKCIPRSIKTSLITKQPKCESMRSPLSNGPRISSDRMGSSRIISPCTSNGGSKRITDPTPLRKLDSCRNESDNVFKIEERLASGARVIIQSNASADSEGNF